MFPRTAFPAYGNGDWAIFTPPQSAVLTNSWQRWIKPAGCNMVYMYMQAAGGGGARTLDSNTISCGGGGSGGTSRLLIPAFFLPDVLFIRPGSGGAGRVGSSGAGTAGTQSYVGTRPETTTAFLVMTQAGGGGASGATAGAAGAAGSATAAFLQAAGVWVSVAGQVGANGVATDTKGLDVTPFASGVLTTGGSAGGHGTGAGGDVVAGGWLIQTITGGAGTTGGAGNGGLGANALLTPQMVFSSTAPQLIFTGGAGGGGAVAAAAGAGGNAGYGGGGGGGGGVSAGAAGNGGNGGDGFIMIGVF
jgi:hypothetical protein